MSTPADRAARIEKAAKALLGRLSKVDYEGAYVDRLRAALDEPGEPKCKDCGEPCAALQATRDGK